MRKPTRTATQRAAPLIIGWREHVGLPDLGLDRIAAKIDTGARTSALHASRIRTFERDGALWVSFYPTHGRHDADHRCEALVRETRDIKNTSGVPESRIVIRTRLTVAGRKWTIDLSLADRWNMSFPLIVGRSSLSHHRIAVDTGRSYLTDRKTRKKKPARRPEE